MASDSRNRDLKFSILSDASKFELSKPADQLNQLGDAADDAGRAVDELGDDARAAGRQLRDEVGDAAGAAGRDLDELERAARGVDLEDKLGDDAKQAASKVDDAFDKIAKSSHAAQRKVDDDTDRMRDGLDDVGDEAGQTAREMGASFSGGADDVMDAFQELGANAAAAFGPVGIAAGVAMATGIGFMRAEAEKLKEDVSTMVEAMIEAGGKLSAEAIDSKLQEMAADGTLKTLKEQAQGAGVSFGDLARAHAGDAEALDRVRRGLFDASDAMNRNVREGKIGTQQAYNQKLAIDEVARGLGYQTEVQKLAAEATADYGRSTQTAAGTAKTQAHVAGAAWDDLRANMGRPINARVSVTGPPADVLRGIRAGIQAGIGTVVVPLKVAGASTKYDNVASNSKYRW